MDSKSRVIMGGSSRAPSSVLATRVLYMLTALPICLAAFAFILQWRGEDISDPTRWDDDSSKLPGGSKISSSPLSGHSVTSSDCAQNSLLGSKNPAFPYQQGWHYSILADAHPKISICTSTSAGLEQILPWLFYHRVIGVTNFFLFVEGKAASAEVSAVLESIPGVKVIYRTKELEEKQAKSRIWNETWLSSFFFRPCNYELFVKQSLNMEMAIILARESGMDWIIHLDTDELIHPAGHREYSLRSILKDVEADVDMVIFPNYESAIEGDDIKDPFCEISMFKKNYDHVTKETYFGLYREATRGNPNYFLTYGNGKSAARIQDHLRPNGAHRWHNYMKTPKEIKLEEAAVLHYTYAKFSDLSSRRDRCGCKPTQDDVKRCFMLEFDRAAFIIASTATDEEMHKWYLDRVVWTDKELNLKLMRKGLLTRIYAPMVIVQGLRESSVFREALLAGQARLQEKSLSSSSPGQNNTSAPKVERNQTDILKSIEGVKSTMRKLLETELTLEEYNAIAPLPSPSIEDITRLSLSL